MALRLIYLCIMCTTPSPVPSGTSCYKTVKGVPEECAQIFIKALFTNNTKGVTDHCCLLLACVRECTCADVLRRFCLPPWVDDCPGSPKRPPLSRPAAIAPAVSL